MLQEVSCAFPIGGTATDCRHVGGCVDSRIGALPKQISRSCCYDSIFDRATWFEIDDGLTIFERAIAVQRVAQCDQAIIDTTGIERPFVDRCSCSQIDHMGVCPCGVVGIPVGRSQRIVL